MLEQIFTISLIITAIYATYQPGMIFGRPAAWMTRKLEEKAPVLVNPICGCLTCMGGVYTLAIYPVLYGVSWRVLPVMCGVIGTNYIISAILTKLCDE